MNTLLEIITQVQPTVDTKWLNNTESDRIDLIVGITQDISHFSSFWESIVSRLREDERYWTELWYELDNWNIQTVWFFFSQDGIAKLNGSCLKWFYDLELDLDEFIKIWNLIESTLWKININKIIEYFNDFRYAKKESFEYFLPYINNDSIQNDEFRSLIVMDEYKLKDMIYLLIYRWREMNIENFISRRRWKLDIKYYENGFWDEFELFEKKSWIVFSNELLWRLFETSSEFSDRFGNWFSAFTRMLSIYINNKKFDKIFQEQVPEDIVYRLEQCNLKNPYLQVLVKQLLSMFTTFTQDRIYNYEAYNSWLNARVKSCKDVESYFWFILSDEDMWKYRIIWNFIEKNINWFDEREKTAISIDDIMVDGIYYPRWYLFRLQKNENENEIKWIEPIRMTIYSWWKQISDFWKDTFGSQYEEFVRWVKTDNGSFPDWDLIDIFISKIQESSIKIRKGEWYINL